MRAGAREPWVDTIHVGAMKSDVFYGIVEARESVHLVVFQSGIAGISSAFQAPTRARHAQTAAVDCSV